ncbi:MAG TPA: MarC family protein [Gemmatimonadaceae bacterium]|jgi:multiple antibiotic resistance protein|nr:MarC family protein [Gemmatimonadaceae bacterium]
MSIYSLGTFTLLCLTSLLAIINPLTTTPLFLSLTEGYTAEHRQRTLRTAVITATTVLVVFALLGGVIFKLFGITIHAFRIAGGVILFGIGMDMLQAKRSRVRATAEEVEEGLEKEDVGITPLGIPMIVGPGSITTVMVLMADVRHPAQVAAVLLAIALVLGGTYVVLSVGPRILRVIGETGVNVMTRIMGLIVTVIAVQFILDGARPVLVDVLRAVWGTT